MEAVPHLRLVNTETGEVVEGEQCPECQHKDDVIAGLERDIRGWAARYRELRRDLEQEARQSDLWPLGERLFVIWQRLTGRRRAKFSYDRFRLVEPFLRKDGFELCAMAIVGRVFDHHTVTRRNGTTKHFYEWERIFKNRGEFEDSANRRPADWQERLAKVDPGAVDTKGGTEQ